MGTANFGIAGMDWQQRVNWDRLREYRIERARKMMKKHGLGAVLCMYDENVRYITATLTPGWSRLKPGLRYAMLCGDGRPILFEQGDIGFQIERHAPWIPKENVRHSFAWIKGAAGPASTQQVTKFAKAVIQAMKDNGVAGPEARLRLHRHQHDPGLQGKEHQLGRRHDPDDGSARGQERGRAGMLPHRRRHRRRHALGVHEVPAPRRHREPGDRASDGISLQHSRASKTSRT